MWCGSGGGQVRHGQERLGVMTVTSHALFSKTIGTSRGCCCCCCCVVLLLEMLLKVQSTLLSRQGVGGVRVFPQHSLAGNALVKSFETSKARINGVGCVEVHLIVSNTCL